ncbi:MAG: hypothetical protein AAB807_00370, partial [Patescibacteria group bacterium]
MEGEKNFNKIPPSGQRKTEREKMIEMGIITPEESETPKSKTSEEENLFKITEEKEKPLRELPEMKVEKEEKPILELTPEMEMIEPDKKEIKEEFSFDFDISEPTSIAEQEKKISAIFKEFGIEQKDLKEIEKFNQLSYGQKLLVAENLKQLTFGRIQEEAALKYRENTTKSKFLGRVWKTISKKYQIAKLEKTTAEEIVKGGIKTHKETLEQLINGQRETGLEVIEKEGKLEIQYAAGFKDLSPEEQKLVENFNKIATKFSQIPDEWRFKSANKKDRGKYKEILGQYEKTKGQLLELILKQNNNNEIEAGLYFNNIDHEVALNQFLNTYPEVEEQLQKIKDKAPLRKVLSDIVTERGLYFAAGAVTRSVTMNLFGLIGMPLAAAGLGGFLAGKRAKETLIEEEKMMRRGGERTRKKISKEEKKNIIKATGINQRFDRLIGQIESAVDEKKRKELLGRLETYADATEARIVKGWINYGKTSERLKNQLDLIQACSRARVCLVSNEKEVKNALKINIEEILNLREKNISKKQRDYILKQAVKGALWGATFALAGYALRHFAGEWFISEKTKVIEPPIGPKTVSAPPAEIAGTAEVMPEKAVSMAEIMEKLPIGKRGPEGAMIDYFKSNPEMAKKFGWDGVKDLKDWAGTKAHQLWLEDAQEALKNPEIINKLKSLGYSQDIDGYDQMMRRIGKGFVELDPKTGKMDLAEGVEYLKAVKSPEAPVESGLPEKNI